MFNDSGNINTGLDSALGKIGLLENGIAGVYQKVKSEIAPRKVMQDADDINRSASKMARESLGRGREISNMLTTTFAQARKNTLEFGIGLQENLDLFKAINNQLQTTRLLTSQQLTDMNALAMSVGLTAEEMAGFVKNFDMLGKGTDDAIGAIARLQTEARSYGLNVGQFMKTVGENIKLVASYNFKGGVDGLSKMVAQAQSLRIDMANTVKFAEDLMDPTKAIETAAGFQMIGGAVGKLGDPFQLLHMAQTDMAGLQDELVNMSAAAVTFNESTGEFDIPVTELYRLREVATLTGIGFQELSEMALNSAKKTKKLEFLSGLNFTEEQKEMIANMGEIQDGKVMIGIGDEMVEASKLNKEQLEKLGDFQEDLNKDDKELRVEAVQTAKESLGVLEKIEAKIAQTLAIPETDIIVGGKFEDISKNISERVNLSVEVLNEKIAGIQFDEQIVSVFDKLVPEMAKETIEGGVDMIIDIARETANAIQEFTFESFISRPDRNYTGDGDGNAVNYSDNGQGRRDRNYTGDFTFSNSSIAPDSPTTPYSIYNDFGPINDSLNSLNDTLSNLLLNEPVNTPVNPENVNVNVGGTITVNIAGTDINMTQEELNRMVTNNPTLMAIIMEQLTGSENNFGGTNSYVA